MSRTFTKELDNQINMAPFHPEAPVQDKINKFKAGTLLRRLEVLADLDIAA